MSEEKIIQHTKTALGVVHKKATLKEKAKEFIGEIIIIIIAVSITVAFHNWNDERHEEKIARDFLAGTSKDLKTGAQAITASIQSFQPTIDYYNKVWTQIKQNKIDAKYVDTQSYFLRNTNYFVFDNSRFEGFKSSGYLRLVTNDRLLKHLVTLYTISMPFEKEADANFFQRRAEDFDHYIGSYADIDTTGNFLVSRLLNQKQVRYHIYAYGQILNERKEHKKLLAKRCSNWPL